MKRLFACPILLAGCLAIPTGTGGTPQEPVAADQPVRVGADRILADPYRNWISGKKVGLITNQTGVDSRLQSTAQKLIEDPEVQLVALFAPEHGLLGSAQAGQKIENSPRAYSLYGSTRAPTPEMLKDVEVLLYDIQDVGARFYTYISTLAESLKAAAREEIPFVVLDRPTPIGGHRVEGPVLEAGFESFVGIYRLPIRYGMTAAEIAGFLNQEADIGADLKVVSVEHWSREHWFDDTGLVWVPPSPNMPTVTTATVYPGMCLIEGTNLSEGRGTTRPFEWIGAPWLSSARLTEKLNRLELPGVLFRPQAFTPTFSKYEGQLCYGLQVHVTDRSRFDPILTLLHLLAAVRELHPDRFSFVDASFDRLMGNSWVRGMLLDGKSPKEIQAKWEPELAAFRERRQAYLLY